MIDRKDSDKNIRYRHATTTQLACFNKNAVEQFLCDVEFLIVQKMLFMKLENSILLNSLVQNQFW